MLQNSTDLMEKGEETNDDGERQWLSFQRVAWSGLLIFVQVSRQFVHSQALAI
jgi:hypothetical protein